MYAIALQNQDLKIGDKVFYIGEKGSQHQIEEANELLQKQKSYTIINIQHGRFETYYILDGYDFIKFNALLFKDYYSQ